MVTEVAVMCTLHLSVQAWYLCCCQLAFFVPMQEAADVHAMTADTLLIAARVHTCH